MFTADIGGTIRHGDSERMIQIIENQKCVVDNLVRKGALREEAERFFMPDPPFLSVKNEFKTG